MLWQHARNHCRDNYRNKSRFQRMVSQLRCLTIGTKTPVSSGVAPQRADSTRYRASVVDPARMHRATLCTNRHTAASDNAMGAPLSAFFFAFIFWRKLWFDINLCQILIEFRWCETLSRLVQTSCTFARLHTFSASPPTYYASYWSHSETLFLQFVVPKNAF